MERRLQILCDGGVIDRDIHDGMLEVVRRLESEWGIAVHNPQGEMAMTHMANALMRCRRGQEIAPIDEAVLQEAASDACWPELLAIHCVLVAIFDVALHPNEEGYLLANLYGLWLEKHAA